MTTWFVTVDGCGLKRVQATSPETALAAAYTWLTLGDKIAENVWWVENLNGYRRECHIEESQI